MSSINLVSVQDRASHSFFRLFVPLTLCLGFMIGSAFLHSAKAQTTVSGTVIGADSLGVIGAAVQILRSDSTMVAGDATDLDGRYTIKNVKAGNYILKVSHLNYKADTRNITVGASAKKIPRIFLEPTSEMLDRVTVVGKAVDMRIMGDTLEFSAGNFGVQAGSVLEDLIKRLPGAEIDDEGKITINGKEISKIMIDGKEFFSGDTKVASKNIPVDAIDKVQVLERLSDMARMTGFDDGEEETVINLTVKAGRKKGLFGNAFAGYGLPDNRYEANAMVNRFAGDNQWTVLAGSNNTNNQGFSEVSEGGSSIGFGQNMGGGGRGRGGFRGGRSGVTLSAQLGANAYFIINPKVELGGNVQYGYSDQDIKRSSLTTNILPQGSTTQTENTLQRALGHNGGVDMKLTWKPDKYTELIYSPSLYLRASRDTYSNDYQTINEANDELNNGEESRLEDSRRWTTRHRLDASRVLNDEGRTLSLSLFARYGTTETDGFYQSSLRTAGVPTSMLDYNLKSNTSSAYYRAEVSWVEPLGKQFFLQALYNLQISDQKSLRKAYNPSLTGSYDDPWLEYGSDYRNTLYTHQVGLNVKKIFAKSDLTFGLTFDPSITKSRRESGLTHLADTTITRYNVAPVLRFTWKPDRNTNLRVMYRGRTNQPSINQLLPVPDITNPLVEIIGNPNLRPSFTNMIFARMQAFFPNSRQSIYASLHGRYVLDDIVSRSVYDKHTGKRTTNYENVSGNASLGVNATYTTPLGLRELTMRLSAFAYYNHSLGFVNNEKNIANSISNNDQLSIVYQNSWLYAALKGNFGFYHVANSIGNDPITTTYNYGGGGEVNITLPYGFRIETDVDYATNAGFSSNYKLNQTLLNAAVSYSFLKNDAAMIRVKAYDILNQRSAIERQATALMISENRTNTLGRYAILQFVYRFNSFSNGGSRNDMKAGGGGGHPY